MIHQELIGRTVIGKTARRFNVKFNVYYAFLVLLNFAGFFLAMYDAKGLVILFFTIGFSMVIRLMLTQREEQRLTNELLEELVEQNVPLRPAK
ncbi:hypothetical protein D3875_03350 [Deinococcus cavernae]|uniref:Uncharacterized protein n=1 Tax=Deinococcus cavernae TaxID=2320857 RepID=A0A418VEU2_9DEIO|nr:hypothetical protein [Deinococcus cavernae]RJF74590.1 hypothetical protein D3875_03350 [Deinococcus cavernae]